VPTLDRTLPRPDVEGSAFANAPTPIRDSAPRMVPPSGPRKSVAELRASSPISPFGVVTDRRSRTSVREIVRARRFRIAATVAGLIGLALVSFAIALAASEGKHGARDKDPRALDAAAAVAARPMDAAAVVVAVPVAPTVPVDAAQVIPAPTVPADAGRQLGYLEISTTPEGATIRIDGQARLSPADFVLDAGDIQMTAELDGYAPEHRVIHLVALEHETVEIVMTHKPSGHDRPSTTSGRLSVRTNPTSEVYDGVHRIGETPFADFELPPGTHVLTFKNPQHPTTQKTIVVVAGKAQKLSFDLP
jgi:hypothetical protein